MVNTWGSDIFYFQHFPEHLETIRDLLVECDYLIPDCARDEALARTYRLQRHESRSYSRVPADIRSRRCGDPSPAVRSQTRRVVMVKGYQGWAGRAIQALEALLILARTSSEGYEIVVYAASPATVQQVRQLQATSRLNLQRAAAKSAR